MVGMGKIKPTPVKIVDFSQLGKEFQKMISSLNNVTD
jgi:hypothetical protein